MTVTPSDTTYGDPEPQACSVLPQVLWEGSYPKAYAQIPVPAQRPQGPGRDSLLRRDRTLSCLSVPRF